MYPATTNESLRSAQVAIGLPKQVGAKNRLRRRQAARDQIWNFMNSTPRWRRSQSARLGQAGLIVAGHRPEAASTSLVFILDNRFNRYKNLTPRPGTKSIPTTITIGARDFSWLAPCVHPKRFRFWRAQ
jgi:hypothetical protein